MTLGQQSPKRKAITHFRRLTLGRLDRTERTRLCDELYAIYDDMATSLDRQRFEELFLSDDSTRVALFIGSDGKLAGFSNATILRVNVDGKDHAVFNAGVYIRLGYRGGSVGAIFGLTEALRFKVQHPMTPLSYMAVTATPAPYCLYARTVDRLYPSRHVTTPASIEALVRQAAQARKLIFVGDGPWLVRSLAAPRHKDKLDRSHALRNNPDARFFVEQNPRYAEGTAMLVWIPLDLANITTALVRASRHFIRSLF